MGSVPGLSLTRQCVVRTCAHYWSQLSRCVRPGGLLAWLPQGAYAWHTASLDHGSQSKAVCNASRCPSLLIAGACCSQQTHYS
jgi:hypothetical protein